MNGERKLGTLSHEAFKKMTTTRQLGLIEKQVFCDCLYSVLPEVQREADAVKREYDFDIFFVWYYYTFIDTVNDDDHLCEHDGKNLEDIENGGIYNSYRECVNSSLGFTFEEWWLIFNIFCPFIKKKYDEGFKIDVYYFPDLVLVRRYFSRVLNPKYQIIKTVKRLETLGERNYNDDFSEDSDLDSMPPLEYATDDELPSTTTHIPIPIIPSNISYNSGNYSGIELLAVASSLINQYDQLGQNN